MTEEQQEQQKLDAAHRQLNTAARSMTEFLKTLTEEQKVIGEVLVVVFAEGGPIAKFNAPPASIGRFLADGVACYGVLNSTSAEDRDLNQKTYQDLATECDVKPGEVLIGHLESKGKVISPEMRSLAGKLDGAEEDEEFIYVSEGNESIN